MTKRTSLRSAAVAAILVLFTSTLGLAGPRHGERGGPAFGRALSRADDLYAAGDLTGAMQWLDRARAVLADELADGPRPDGLARSNAEDLLRVLSWYNAYARGRDPDLDRSAAFLAEHLELIVMLECGPDRPSRLGDLSVSTWADGKVHRLGDVDVSHWADGRIHRLGDVDISYWADGRVFRIGGIDLDYRAGEKRPWRIAGVECR